jgi:4'-phosphopantetheinyl transferase EntD
VSLIFSAKESLFKCLSPIVKEPLSFKSATIDFSDQPNNSFTWQLAKSVSVKINRKNRGTGRFVSFDNKVFTVIELLR